MRIFITVSEEPVYINPFIRTLIEALPHEIVGIGIQKGKGLVTGKTPGRKLEYLLTLAVISGPLHLAKRFFLFGTFLLCEKLSFTGLANPLSISRAACRLGIPVTYCDDVNSREFMDFLRQQNVDVIINQAQRILSKEFIEIPRIGCLNRHAALLPKYRGRLAPFWAYLRGEKETGLSIHFIDEQLDNGPILVQKRVSITSRDTVDSLLDRIFLQVAPGAMLEALELIRTGRYLEYLIDNDATQATYYSSPRLKDALEYRRVLFRRLFLGTKHHDVC